jgi:hypothetical protein
MPAGMTNPMMRAFFFIWMYLTAPIEAVLYPIAGVGGLVGAGVLYLLARMTGGGYDTTHGWAWTGCFLGVVALMRTETRIEDEHPYYKSLRRWLRLSVSFAGMFYFGRHEQGNPAGVASIVAAVFTAMVYLVLRSKWLRFVWHGLQQVSWMRRTVASPLTVLPQ